MRGVWTRSGAVDAVIDAASLHGTALHLSWCGRGCGGGEGGDEGREGERCWLEARAV